jgi:hypothetical protein
MLRSRATTQIKRTHFFWLKNTFPLDIVTNFLIAVFALYILSRYQLSNGTCLFI